MKAWLLYSEESSLINKKYIEFYILEGEKLNIEINLVLVDEVEFGIKDKQHFIGYKDDFYFKKNLTCGNRPDFIICRLIYPLLSKHFEYMGIPVFNNSVTAEICNDKAKTHQYLGGMGLRMVDSSFYLNSQIKDVFKKAKSPIIIKAVEGHGGSQVYLYDPQKTNLIHKEEISQGIKGSPMVVQPFIDGGQEDLRVYVIGKKIIASVLRKAKKGFKSNYSLGGHISLYELKNKERKIVEKIINKFDFGLVGIDFLIGSEGELIFNEIEDVVGSRMLYGVSNINIVELYLKHILKKITN